MKLIEKFFHERNSSPSTQTTYKRSIKYYEQITHKTINQLLKTAENEENNNIRWKNTQTREYIITYRNWLYEKYNISTAQLYLTAITTIYRHFELTIPPLPYYNTKNSIRSNDITYDDLPDRDILREAINITSPLARSIILFMSSSGVSRIDTLNLTLQDYIKATSEYHDNNGSVKQLIKQLQEQDQVIPLFRLHRQKTGTEYYTFCSPEAVKSINSYLLTRTEILEPEGPLFKIHERYMNLIFERLNNSLNLGKVGNYNRLRPHMLRKYHASQLAEAGVSVDHINIMQGRKNHSIAYESYIRLRPEQLREEYIRALPYLVVDDVDRFKTRLEKVNEENKLLESENNMLRDSLDDIVNRIQKLEEDRPSWEDFVKK